MSDGLPESACISVTFSPQGKVIARHLSLPFVSELDGYSVNVIPSPETGKSRVYQSPGGQLWSVVPEGLQEFRDGSWVLHRVPEIAAEPHPSAPGRVIDPIPLVPVRQGLVIFLLPGRLMEFAADTPGQSRTTLLKAAGQTRLERFSGLTLARDGGLWVTGAHGVAKIPGPLRNLKPETVWQEDSVPENLGVENLQAPHEDQQGALTVIGESVTNQRRLVLRFDAAQNWTLCALSVGKLRQAWCASDGTCWGFDIDSLLQWDLGRTAEPFENDEVSARQYFDATVEPGGAFWLATSDGLFRHAPPLWQTPAASRKINSLVRCLAVDPETRLWFVAGNRLCSLQGANLQSHAFRLPGQPGLQPRAFYQLGNGALILAAADPEAIAGDRLYEFHPGNATFDPTTIPDSARFVRALGVLKDGSLCLQTFPDASPAAASNLERFDGRQFELLAEAPSADVIGTNTSSVFTAENGDLWLAGELATACYHERKWRVFASTDKTTPRAALTFAELADGKIWCAAPDEVWEFDGRNWSVLRRAFDRINAMLHTRDGSIWIASNSGLHRYYQGAWLENGTDEGLPGAAVRELFQDQSGLWAATTRGLSLFHPEADKDPPQSTIQLASDSRANLYEGSPVTLTFSAQDKWDYTRRDRLLFSYRRDDLDWSPFQDLNQFSFQELTAGKHYFQVKALDRAGNLELKPAQLEFTILLPWYKETRLVLISVGGIGAALFFAGLAFNRHRQLLHSYAAVEEKVAERTRQLELANRELAHSQKMKALGTLAAGIAHDFNNILSIIKGSTQLIEDNLDNPDKIRLRADRIKTVVEQGAGIVNAMLGFSRESSQEPALCDLNAIVEDTLTLLGDRFLREVQLGFKPTPELPRVMASRDFTQQILLNFIFNAAESMPDNKKIVISTTEVLKLPADMVLLPLEAAAWVAVSVQDFGCGIPAENISRIFEPFFTTKALSAHRGTGLGLSMAYELAKKLGAGLAVQSQVGKGSTFTLILPVRMLPPRATSEPL
jgi:signal transduction histidine kinase